MSVTSQHGRPTWGEPHGKTRAAHKLGMSSELISKWPDGDTGDIGVGHTALSAATC
jgi:hypothetical protein